MSAMAIVILSEKEALTQVFVLVQIDLVLKNFLPHFFFTK